MLGDAVNDVDGCHGDGMIEEGVEMWPILQYLNHYRYSVVTKSEDTFKRIIKKL